MANKKGFAIIAVPITIAILGLLGTGAVMALEHEKNLATQRDEQRKADIEYVQEELAVYYLTKHQYPLQKDESVYGWEALIQAINNLPNDPLASKGWTYSYWSDGMSYTLRYMLEENFEEQVVFGY